VKRYTIFYRPLICDARYGLLNQLFLLFLPFPPVFAIEERRTCALFITYSSVIFPKDCFMQNTDKCIDRQTRSALPANFLWGNKYDSFCPLLSSKLSDGGEREIHCQCAASNWHHKEMF
jgi:hypothetical protein